MIIQTQKIQIIQAPAILLTALHVIQQILGGRLQQLIMTSSL
jgi:hypothetical protein